VNDWSPEADRVAMYDMLTEPWFAEMCFRRGSHRGQPMIPKTDEQKKWKREGQVPLDQQDNKPTGFP
jgi:hypothetical protein